MNEEKLEKLAEIQHEIWSDWMRYLFRFGQKNTDGSLTLPAEQVALWEKQAKTEYKDLSESEKDLDRCEARRVFELFNFEN